MIRPAATILRKDLLLELRTKESVPAMTLFSITVYVLFHFGLDRNSLDGALAFSVQSVCPDVTVGHPDVPRDPRVIAMVESVLGPSAPQLPPSSVCGSG